MASVIVTFPPFIYALYHAPRPKTSSEESSAPVAESALLAPPREFKPRHRTKRETAACPIPV